MSKEEAIADLLKTLAKALHEAQFCMTTGKFQDGNLQIEVAVKTMEALRILL